MAWQVDSAVGQAVDRPLPLPPSLLEDRGRLGPSWLVRSQHRSWVQLPQPHTHPCIEPDVSPSPLPQRQREGCELPAATGARRRWSTDLGGARPTNLISGRVQAPAAVTEASNALEAVEHGKGVQECRSSPARESPLAVPKLAIRKLDALQQAASPLDAEPTTASVPFDPEATQSGESSPSQSSRSGSGFGCKPAEPRAGLKDHWDDRPEDEEVTPMISWSHRSHIGFATAAPAVQLAQITQFAPAPLLEEPADAPPVLEPAVETVAETPRAGRVRARSLGTPAQRLRTNCPEVPGPPMSPRAPFCAAQGFYEAPGFVWSDLDVEFPDSLVEDREDLEPLESFCSRMNSMSTDCPISRMNSLIPDEDKFKSSPKSSPRTMPGASSPRFPTPGQRLAQDGYAERRASRPASFAAHSGGVCGNNLAEHLAAWKRAKEAKPVTRLVGIDMPCRNGRPAKTPWPRTTDPGRPPHAAIVGDSFSQACWSTAAPPSVGRLLRPSRSESAKVLGAASFGEHFAEAWRDTAEMFAQAWTPRW